MCHNVHLALHQLAVIYGSLYQPIPDKTEHMGIKNGIKHDLVVRQQEKGHLSRWDWLMTIELIHDDFIPLGRIPLSRVPLSRVL